MADKEFDELKPPSKGKYWLIFLIAIFYGLCTIVAVRFYDFYYYPLFYLLAAALIVWCYRSWTLAAEASILLLVWLVFRSWGQDPGFLRRDILLLVPLFTTLFIAISHKIRTGVSLELAWAAFITWYAMANTLNLKYYGATEWIMVGGSLLALLVYSLSAFTSVNQIPEKVDVLLCSYSGNTAQYAEHFIAGLKAGGAQVTVHRFHYYRDFKAELNGDGLVVAFPVIGWKPPWPLFYYLWKKLPAGENRPAYVLYSCAGGPENAGFLVWLMLTLKGYKVLGRAWGIYPLNVVTFRLFSKKIWGFLDKIVPRPSDEILAQEAGAYFSQGQGQGLPLIVWPFPLFILGPLLDNKLVDRFLSRNWVKKKLCNACEICVKYCPTQRLTMVNQMPQAAGTCTFCMGCVNLCPTQAMQLRCWTEYGLRYQPRWPEGVVKGK